MTPNEPTNRSAAAASPGRGLKFQLAALSLVAICGLAGLGLARLLKAPPTAPPPVTLDVKLPAHLFQGWDKPDFVFLVTGQQHGYLMPCGCSHPQKGGLERRWNLITLLEQK